MGEDYRTWSSDVMSVTFLEIELPSFKFPIIHDEREETMYRNSKLPMTVALTPKEQNVMVRVCAFFLNIELFELGDFPNSFDIIP